MTRESYPIEVGIAIAVDPSSPIVTWSSLIAPAPEWDMPSQWDPDAERVHGISRWSLRLGKCPQEVMLTLNDLVGAGQQVWCDGGHYDVRWLDVLAVAAGVRPIFELRDIGLVLRADEVVSTHCREVLDRSHTPHRAGPDATRICAALIEHAMQP